MKQIVRISLLVAVVAAGAVLAGCGETYEQRAVLVGVPLPMTTDDVLAAAKAGESEDAIISRLQRSGYDGALTAKDVDRLREEGVPERVVDWMLAHPGLQPFETAPIVGTVEGIPTQEIVYVEREPDVIIVERPPRVHWTVGMSYRWVHYDRPRHRPRYRDRDWDRDRRSPRTRVIRGDRGRVYRYTSGH